VDPDKDVLKVDGKPLSFKSLTYVLLNKPPGVVTTRADEQGRETVLDLLPAKLQHLKPVGRLDMYSEGLLILTNDGDLAQKLTHPSHEKTKRYEVEVSGFVKDPDIKRLQKGINLDDGRTLPAKVTVLERNKSYSALTMTIREGRNRQIRRMFEHIGHPVRRLVRVAVGRLQLGQVASGTWRYLTASEVETLLSD
jgi:23S rRNA pseudouridine2605 synthase